MTNVTTLSFCPALNLGLHATKLMSRCTNRVRARRASLLCPIRWLKEPCDSQQCNEDQNTHRKVIDNVRKTRGHLLRSKAVGEDQAQRPLSVRCLWRGLKRKLRVSWHAPFLVVWRLPKQRKDIRDRRHVLELLHGVDGCVRDGGDLRAISGSAQFPRPLRDADDYATTTPKR